MVQEKKKIRPNAMKSPAAKPVSMAAYKGIKSGETAVGMGKAGRDIQAKLPSAGKVMRGAASTAMRGVVAPIATAAKPAMRAMKSGAEMTGIPQDYRSRKAATRQMGQQREILGMVGDSTKPSRTIAPALQTGISRPGMSMAPASKPITLSKPAMPTDTGSHLMPAGAPSVLSANKMTGGLMRDESTGERYSITGGRGGNMMKVGADGTIDTGFKERSIQRPNLNLMDKPKMVGGYEISDSTWTKDEAERFGRQPGRGATFAERGIVQGSTGGSGRSIGGRSYGDPLAMAKKIMGPMKIDTKGFSGTGAQARAHTQEVNYNDKLAKLAGELAQTSMGVESGIARTAMEGEIASRSQRERFGLQGQEAAQQEGYDVEAANVESTRAIKAADVKAKNVASEKAKERMWDLVKSKGQKPMSQKEQAELRFKAQELYLSSGGEEAYGSFGEFMKAEMSGMEGMVGLGGQSQRPVVNFPQMVTN